MAGSVAYESDADSSAQKQEEYCYADSAQPDTLPAEFLGMTSRDWQDFGIAMLPLVLFFIIFIFILKRTGKRNKVYVDEMKEYQQKVMVLFENMNTSLQEIAKKLDK